MSDLAVDIAGLRALASTLGSVRSNLDATRRVVEATRDAVGSDVVHDALVAFEDRWADGRGQIDKNMQATQEVLQEAARAYEQTDQELADGLRDSMAGEGA